MKRKIIWDSQAAIYCGQAISYIRKQSPQNANKVKGEILQKIGELSNSPGWFGLPEPAVEQGQQW